MTRFLPQGVFANLTINLSTTFDSKFLRVFGAMYAAATLLVWIFVASHTVALVHNRKIFEVALEDLEVCSSTTNLLEGHNAHEA